jgi:hypothetical protein
VDIVTLIDHQWYSNKTIGKNHAPLLISIISMMRAHDEVEHRSVRLGAVWEKKRKQAIEDGTPMTSVCPGWLTLRPDEKGYNPIPERVKKVRLIFWLFNRGWSPQRIAALFNRNKVRPWGVGDKKANGWHHSYIKKILWNRAVLGEFIPHSTRKTKGTEVTVGPRKPVTNTPIRGYYPAIVPEAVFQKAQLRSTGPRGPIGRRVTNLFQGLLKDGDHPEFSMCYKDHGDPAGKWRYVASDYQRLHQDAPKFSWNYNALEDRLLSYLRDLDWSVLTVGKDTEIRKLRDDLATAEGRLQDLDGQVRQVVELVKAAANIQEAVTELEGLEKRRAELRATIGNLRVDLRSRQGFTLVDGAALIKQLAADRKNPSSRFKLRDAIRQYVTRIELYRAVPTSLTKGVDLPAPRPGVNLQELLQGRCARILFSNGAERWVVGQGDTGVRIEGAKLPPKERMVINKDELADGHVILDASKDSSKDSSRKTNGSKGISG